MKLLFIILVLLVGCESGQNGGNQGGGNGGANTQAEKCLAKSLESISTEVRDLYIERSNEYYAFLSFKLKQECPSLTFEQLEKEITK